MRLFDELCIETQSSCNRNCPTCLRQSYPDKTALIGRDEALQMPADLVHSLIDQAQAMGFRGWLILQHFNEPLQDPRIAELGRYGLHKFHAVIIHTNGDYLTRETAAELDGAFDLIRVALYSGDKIKRAAQYSSMFRKTALDFTMGEHVATHYCPNNGTEKLIQRWIDEPCEREAQMRCIVGYDGRMMLCCEDIACLYDLGNAHETSLRDLWFGERHTEILDTLSHPGGRRAYSYCAVCPRVYTPYWSVKGAA